jgi:hypothetical protein
MTTNRKGLARSNTSQLGTFPFSYFASDSIAFTPQDNVLLRAYIGLAGPDYGQLINVDALHDEFFPDDSQGYNIAAV